MELKIIINLDNAAFEDDDKYEEVARILYDKASKICNRDFILESGEGEYCMDVNGNRVGDIEVTGI